MAEEFTIVSGITAEIWTAPEADGAKGLILNPGRELTADELEEVAMASDTNARVWEAMRDMHGLFAHARGAERDSPPKGFTWFNHLPNIPNVLPHSDDQDFILFTDVPRWGQDTVVAQRKLAVEVFMEVVGKFLEEKFPQELEWFRPFREGFNSYFQKRGGEYNIPTPSGQDFVTRLFFYITCKLEELGFLTDFNLFELTSLIDRKLEGGSFKCSWNQTMLLFITKQAFHYRYCQAADLIRKNSVGMWHRVI